MEGRHRVEVLHDAAAALAAQPPRPFALAALAAALAALHPSRSAAGAARAAAAEEHRLAARALAADLALTWHQWR